MPSGRKLTTEEVHAILRLAGQLDDRGGWRLTYGQIAERLELNRATVYRQIRRAAVLYGRLTAWKADEIGLTK